jgi:hypothetical protein
LPGAVYFCLAAGIPIGVLESSAGTDHAGKTDPFTPSLSVVDDRVGGTLLNCGVLTQRCPSQACLFVLSSSRFFPCSSRPSRILDYWQSAHPVTAS